ncbi:MAG: FG-GAP repeat protein, partial [Deltaproteobacteria bacterium]|nr:FG-GAP repeat protein [Deltaproteobacteria bacterium]
LVGAPKHDAGGTDAGAVFLVSGTGVSTGNLADVALSVFVGEGSYNDAGIAVAGIQDQDGDGLNEVAIGASGYLNSSDAFGNGAVYIFSGSDLEEELDLADASVKIVGESFYDIAGSAIDSGDVDGDGIADLAMSSLNSHEAGVSSSIGAGRADVFFGELDSDVLTTDESDVTILGESGGDRLGNAISVAGDLDFDGYNDLVTCAELEDTYGERTGSCYLFLSSAISFSGVLQAGEDESIKLVGYESGAHLGSAVTIGNINGDSYDDLVVGENGEGLSSHSSHIGGAYVLYGPLEEMGTADMTDVADVFLQGENRTDYAGTGITTGDYNADNKSDLSIGAPGYDDFGRSNTGRDYTFYGLGE